MKWPSGGGPGDGVKVAVRADVDQFRRGSRSKTNTRRLAVLARLPKEHREQPGREDPFVAMVRDVGGIITDVAKRGDEALRELALRLDGVELEELEVPRVLCDEALASLGHELRAALDRAERNIASFHRATKPQGISVEVEPGVRVSQMWDPLDRVGVYAPGGRAAYPSSVLMGVVPARVAGVGEVIVCSPPGPDGRPSKEVMAACSLGRADRLFAIGGAGAVAAMAHGTKSVPQVGAIVGPGNAWVTEAKRQVAGRVRIDSLAGPSEVLVVADDEADPYLVALELVAQAEHDPEAACVLVTTSRDVAASVEKELPAIIEDAPRKEIIETSLKERGAILTARGLTEALGFADWYAPEHLVMMVKEPEEAIDVGRPSAGTVFLGPYSSVAFGDYLTGANHVLPTGRQADTHSGLSTRDFMRSWTIQEISEEGAASLAGDTAVLASAEGLSAHAEAARARAGDGPPPRSRRLRVLK